MTIEGASAALRVRGRGQGHSLHERKGPGQLCAQEEGARAAVCVRGRGQGSSVCEMKVFYHNFFTATLHFLHFLHFSEK